MRPLPLLPLLPLLFVCATTACERAASRGAARGSWELSDEQGAWVRQLPELELRGEGSMERLVALSRSADPSASARALRALGRRGDAAARARLEAALASESTVEGAAEGLAVAGDPRAEVALLEALARARAPLRARIVEALGRVGGLASLPALTASVRDPEPGLARAAALALGIGARRKIGLDDEARVALIAASAGQPEALRWAATYALARAHAPLPEPSARAALLARLGEADPELRAEALIGLGRLEPSADAASMQALIAGLEDPSWLVQIAALRGLGGPTLPDAALAAICARAEALGEALLVGEEIGPFVHVLEDILGRLGAHAEAAPVRALAERLEGAAASRLRSLAIGEAPRDPRPWVAASRIHCRAAALAVRGGAGLELSECGGPLARGSARHLRRQIWAELAGEGLAGGLATLRALAFDADPRVQAAAMAAAQRLAEAEGAGRVEGAGVAAVPEGGDAAGARALLIEGLSARSPAVVGAAAGALAQAAKSTDDREWLRARLIDALVSALGDAGGDPELEGALLEALTAALEGLARLGDAPTSAARAAARGRCEAALGRGLAGQRASARACLSALGEAQVEGIGDAAVELPRPPFEPALAGTIRWTIDTTQGVFVVELDPSVAPWSVGALVWLSGRGFFNGSAWHRVVPGFVVQGGDPSGTGAGGPGFALPGEPSLRPFGRGAVGIADAGLHTGGSQWFVMHARAPHLEGRYTWVGEVVEGMDVVDRLTTDDRIVHTWSSGRREE